MTAAALQSPDTAYQWYFDALDGKNPPVKPRTPECGFFRKIAKDKRTRAPIWLPVAIYYAGDYLVAQVGSHLVEDPDEIADLFGECALSPVSEDTWRAVAEDGAPWPDMLPAPAAIDYSNLPADPLDSLLQELEGERMELDRFLAGGINSQDDADRAANWKSRIAEIEKRADAMRKAEKKPHDDAAAAVQARFKPALEIASGLKKQIDAAMTPYLRAKAQREAEERAKQAATGEAIAAPKTAKAGTLGRSMALTTRREAVIENAEELALFFVRASNPDLIECLQKLANKVAVAGGNPPGCRIELKQTAR